MVQFGIGGPGCRAKMSIEAFPVPIWAFLKYVARVISYIRPFHHLMIHISYILKAPVMFEGLGSTSWLRPTVVEKSSGKNRPSGYRHSRIRALIHVVPT